MDAAQQNVQYHNTVACGKVRAVIILADPGTEQREKSPLPPQPWQTAPGSPMIGNNKSTWKNDRKLHEYFAELQVESSSRPSEF